MNKPCYDCPDREIGCHSDCDKYLCYKEKLKEKKAFLEVDRAFGDYLYHATKRMKGG
ncbi:hypothetical protein [Tissierella sp. P1]|uniref:hypothetical protein n=1 Tax=Tissierella sp. P1 TaxID=1280483 RepID=UPI001303D248|nr:hypothetical protein [Tissierella sp. P1]